MKYHRFPPPDFLSNYVACFWTGEATVMPDTTFTHFAIAASNARLIFHCGGSFQEVNKNGTLQLSAIAGIQGAGMNPAKFITGKSVAIFGVELYAHAIPFLFALPATTLTDQFTGLDNLLGPAGRQLQEQMLAARNTTERVQLICSFLHKNMTTGYTAASQLIPAIQEINAAEGQINIQQLMQRYALSQRQFERAFKSLTGLTPKSYARVRRFESVLARMQKKTASLTTLALESGYYDQAHFNHDFLAFTGFNPGQYMEIISGYPTLS